MELQDVCVCDIYSWGLLTARSLMFTRLISAGISDVLKFECMCVYICIYQYIIWKMYMV